VYFSPNTHLLGEAVALHALGVLFPDFSHAARWAEHGGRIVEQGTHAELLRNGRTYAKLYELQFEQPAA